MASINIGVEDDGSPDRSESSNDKASPNKPKCWQENGLLTGNSVITSSSNEGSALSVLEDEFSNGDDATDLNDKAHSSKTDNVFQESCSMLSLLCKELSFEEAASSKDNMKLKSLPKICDLKLKSELSVEDNTRSHKYTDMSEVFSNLNKSSGYTEMRNGNFSSNSCHAYTNANEAVRKKFSGTSRTPVPAGYTDMTQNMSLLRENNISSLSDTVSSPSCSLSPGHYSGRHYNFSKLGKHCTCHSNGQRMTCKNCGTVSNRQENHCCKSCGRCSHSCCHDVLFHTKTQDFLRNPEHISSFSSELHRNSPLRRHQCSCSSASTIAEKSSHSNPTVCKHHCGHFVSSNSNALVPWKDSAAPPLHNCSYRCCHSVEHSHCHCRVKESCRCNSSTCQSSSFDHHCPCRDENSLVLDRTSYSSKAGSFQTMCRSQFSLCDKCKHSKLLSHKADFNDRSCTPLNCVLGDHLVRSRNVHVSATDSNKVASNCCHSHYSFCCNSSSVGSNCRHGSVITHKCPSASLVSKNECCSCKHTFEHQQKLLASEAVLPHCSHFCPNHRCGVKSCNSGDFSNSKSLSLSSLNKEPSVGEVNCIKCGHSCEVCSDPIVNLLRDESLSAEMDALWLSVVGSPISYGRDGPVAEKTLNSNSDANLGASSSDAGIISIKDKMLLKLAKRRKKYSDSRWSRVFGRKKSVNQFWSSCLAVITKNTRVTTKSRAALPQPENTATSCESHSLESSVENMYSVPLYEGRTNAFRSTRSIVDCQNGFSTSAIEQFDMLESNQSSSTANVSCKDCGSCRICRRNEDSHVCVSTENQELLERRALVEHSFILHDALPHNTIAENLNLLSDMAFDQICSNNRSVIKSRNFDDNNFIKQNDVNSCAAVGIHTIHTQVDFVHYLVPDLQTITNCNFYWGKMDRYEAERLLDKKPEGTFLLRDSAQAEYLFSVSFRRYGKSLHARIEHGNHKFSFDSHDPGVFASDTVCGLVEHYKDPSSCMFFEPMLTNPLCRSFAFPLQHLCRAMICSLTSYDGINKLELPKVMRQYLKEYHYKQLVRVRRLDH